MSVQRVKIGTAFISAEALDEEGTDIIIRVELSNKMASYQELIHIISIYFNQAYLKYVENDKGSPLH
jgi:hypothetical protein